ncbi:putative inner membrane protein [Escherichia coli]|uniref:Putative inner membrane protein n=1 Tax=Escherichia coli TaxID=562 RepID=A0A376KWK4_ECOLX|nr:putative inner membrane protein [Escherichia coli]
MNATKRAICCTATATGKGRAFCEKLAQQAGIDQSHPALQRWYASIHETQNDREVVSLYAHLVQPVLDAQARREISRSAAESTFDDCGQPAGVGPIWRLSPGAICV